MTKNMIKATKNSTLTNEVKFRILRDEPRFWDNYEAGGLLEMFSPKQRRYIEVGYYTRLRDAKRAVVNGLAKMGLGNAPFKIFTKYA